jgi:hypothetical protein
LRLHFTKLLPGEWVLLAVWIKTYDFLASVGYLLKKSNNLLLEFIPLFRSFLLYLDRLLLVLLLLSDLDWGIFWFVDFLMDTGRFG